MTTYVRFTKDLEKPEHLAAKKDACRALEDRTARKLINAGYAYELPHDKAVQVFGLEEKKPLVLKGGEEAILTGETEFMPLGGLSEDGIEAELHSEPENNDG